MAERLVGSVLAIIGSHIFQELLKEANLVLGVQQQVENLATTLRSLQVYLRDADVKQVNDAGVKAWLEELKHIAYDADDVLDEWHTRFQLSQLNPVTLTFIRKTIYYLFSPCSCLIPTSCSWLIPTSCSSCVPASCFSFIPTSCPSCVPASCFSFIPASCPSFVPASCSWLIPTSCSSFVPASCPSFVPASCFSFIPTSCSCFDDLRQHRRIANEIQGINESLDRIDRDRTRYGLTQNPIQQSPHWRDTCSLVHEDKTFGRVKDKELILEWLLVNVAESGKQEIRMPVPVIAIVGTAGFGKTTLAQLVFKLEKTKYEHAIWVCVSQPFDLKKVIKEIIEQATGKKATNFTGLEAMHKELSDSIERKRFLIVLDDVWSKNPNDWTSLKLSLDSGATGSNIIVTARDEGVAKMMGSTRTHRLDVLSEEECWLLFQHIAFNGRSKKERETLETVRTRSVCSRNRRASRSESRSAGQSAVRGAERGPRDEAAAYWCFLVEVSRSAGNGAVRASRSVLLFCWIRGAQGIGLFWSL